MEGSVFLVFQINNIWLYSMITQKCDQSNGFSYSIFSSYCTMLSHPLFRHNYRILCRRYVTNPGQFKTSC